MLLTLSVLLLLYTNTGSCLNKDYGVDRKLLAESVEDLEEASTGGLTVCSLRLAGTSTHVCSGTLIAPRWVLTAARCLEEMDRSVPNVKPEVVFGSSSGQMVYKTLAVEKHLVSGSDEVPEYDVALLLLDREAPGTFPDFDLTSGVVQEDKNVMIGGGFGSRPPSAPTASVSNDLGAAFVVSSHDGAFESTGNGGSARVAGVNILCFRSEEGFRKCVVARASSFYQWARCRIFGRCSSPSPSPSSSPSYSPYYPLSSSPSSSPSPTPLLPFLPFAPLPSYPKYSPPIKKEAPAEGPSSGETELAKLYLDPAARLPACPADSDVFKMQRNEDITYMAHDAVLGDDYAALALLVCNGLDVDSVVTYSDNTLLHVASQFGAPYSAWVLAESGANLEKLNSAGDTPLYEAVVADEIEVAKTLLFKRANPDAENKAGYTSLIYASSYGHSEAVQVLLNYGAAVNQVSVGLKKTALGVAAEGGHLETVKILLRAGASKTIRDGAGHVPREVVCVKAECSDALKATLTILLT